jgi:GDPmannose 4,6-dehydratase
VLNSIVLGANGQDGSYLCELLAASGQRVIGVGRQSGYARPRPTAEFRYVQVDLCDREALRAVLTSENPHHIYHVAAVHGESGFRYEGVVAELFAVSVLSTHVCLEYLRDIEDGRLFYASSGKVFGNSPKHTITEASAKRADCIYSTAKIAAGHLIDCYRRDHGIHAIVAYLFNHESPRRGAAYFVPKIARALANGLAGQGDPVAVKSLDFFADWGSAREYMDMSMRAMQLGLDGDYVFATGQTVWAAAAVEAAFDCHKLDYRDWLRFPEMRAATPAVPFVADASRLTTALGYAPRQSFSQLVDEIAAANYPS